MIKYFFITTLLTIVLMNTVCATERLESLIHKEHLAPNDLLCMFVDKQPIIISKSGCCSWHSGVCGCSGGRQLCCDGTLSPSCACNSDSNDLLRR
jgi:hypothetical protein